MFIPENTIITHRHWHLIIFYYDHLKQTEIDKLTQEATHKASFQNVPSQSEQYPCQEYKERKSEPESVKPQTWSEPLSLGLVQPKEETSPELFSDCLTLQGFHIEVVGSSWHDEERDDCRVTVVDLWHTDQAEIRSWTLWDSPSHRWQTRLDKSSCTNTNLPLVNSWVWLKPPRRCQLLCWRTHTFQQWRGTDTCPGWSQDA